MLSIHHKNRIKTKTPILKKSHDHLNREKTFKQNPTPLKTFHKLGIEGNFYNLIKGIYKEAHS